MPSMKSIPMPSAVRAALALLALSAALPAQSEEHDCLVEARDTVEIRSSVEGIIDKVLAGRAGWPTGLGARDVDGDGMADLVLPDDARGAWTAAPGALVLIE